HRFGNSSFPLCFCWFSLSQSYIVIFRTWGDLWRMTSKSALAAADPLRAEEVSGDWVLSLSRQEPGRLPPSSVRWAERGALRGFFDGLLFDREELAASFNRGEQDCSDAEL